WTFRLKSGIRYAPPLASVDITSADIVRALERYSVLTGRFGADVTASAIVGFDAYARGRGGTISGLETPDARTLVVRLQRPQGDLGAWFAAPWTAPIPPSPHDPGASGGVAAGRGAEYGRYLVGSGPYMIAGSPDLDPSLPAAQQRPVA